jgi:hypothetical protein
MNKGRGASAPFLDSAFAADSNYGRRHSRRSSAFDAGFDREPAVNLVQDPFSFFEGDP